MGVLESKPQKFKQKLETKLKSIYPPPETQLIKTTSKKPTKLAPQSYQKVELSAKPVQDRIESNVSAFDERKQVLTTSEWPYSVYGLLAMKFKGANHYGTGIMIGPNIVLTAGHNLYDFKHKIYADEKSMQFLPGVNGQVLPFGQVNIEKYFVSPNYIAEEKEDYGVLILEESIGEMTGYFGLVCEEAEEIKKKRINIIGYPGDKVASKPNTYEMWGMDGTASHIDQDRGLINYMINTGTGQSGSGVWYQEGEDYYVCGVHVLGSTFVNKATFITRGIYQQIHTWVSLNEKLLEISEKGKLDFSSEEINADCVNILMKYSLDNLTVLNLSWNKIGAEGAKILAKNTSWVNLSQLHLWGNQIGAEGVKAIAQNTSWVGLSQLDLCENEIGPEGAKELGKNTSWINLTWLSLWGNNIGTEGAKGLAENESWVNLSYLILYRNNIDAEGARELAKNESWIQLSKLNLQGNNIGAEGAKELAKNKSWVNLSDLYCNSIGAEGVKFLRENKAWKKEIDLWIV